MRRQHPISPRVRSPRLSRLLKSKRTSTQSNWCVLSALPFRRMRTDDTKMFLSSYVLTAWLVSITADYGVTDGVRAPFHTTARRTTTMSPSVSHRKTIGIVEVHTCLETDPFTSCAICLIGQETRMEWLEQETTYDILLNETGCMFCRALCRTPDIGTKNGQIDASNHRLSTVTFPYISG